MSKAIDISNETQEENKIIDYEAIGQKRWLNISEASAYLGLRLRTLYSYVSERRIPHYKVPGSTKLLFRREELDAFIESGKVETVSEYLKRSHKKKEVDDGRVAPERTGRQVVP